MAGSGVFCDRCGWEMRIGDAPFCGRGRDHQPVRPNIICDEYPGGRFFEHVNDQGVTVYSKSELKRELDKNNLRFTDRYHPNDGPDWRGGIDAQTLANAAVLVTRGQVAKDDPAALETLTTSVRELKALPCR